MCTLYNTPGMYAAHQVGCYTSSVLRLSFCLHCCYYSTDTISFTAYCILIVLPTAGIHTDWTDACSCVMKQTQHCTSAPPSVSLILVIIIVITNIPRTRRAESRTRLKGKRTIEHTLPVKEVLITKQTRSERKVDPTV